MYVERMIYPIEVLGIGKRIGIWTQGCVHHCNNCINPELWEQKEQNNIPVDTLIKCIDRVLLENRVDGVTITGGDPLYQLSELKYLVDLLKIRNLEILLYTGYLKKDIEEMDGGTELLHQVDILIDGPYVEEKNEKGLSLRGSSNQKIYFLNEKIEEKYQSYLNKGRQLQNIYLNDYFISVGMHDKK